MNQYGLPKQGGGPVLGALANSTRSSTRQQLQADLQLDQGIYDTNFFNFRVCGLIDFTLVHLFKLGLPLSSHQQLTTCYSSTTGCNLTGSTYSRAAS